MSRVERCFEEKATFGAKKLDSLGQKRYLGSCYPELWVAGMSEVVRFSEAAALAMHAMALLAEHGEGWMTLKDVAKALAVSESHLAKVLQRLARRGLVNSVRGPRGGFRVAVDVEEVTLLDVYEAVEGPFRIRGCMFASPKCEGACIVGGLLGTVNRQVREHLARARLSDLPALLRSDR